MDKPSKRFKDHHPNNTMQKQTDLPNEKLENTLKIVKRHDQPFPFYREPKQIGCYSLDGNRQFQPNNSEIKFFYPPKNCAKVDFDLNEGYHQAIRKDFASDPGMDSLLRWILDNKNMLLMKNEKGTKDTLQTDFVCYRGLLTKILCTPYENKDDWIIGATKYKGTIYLCGFKTAQDHERHQNETEKDRIMGAWGYKFEQYMMTSTAGKPPDMTQPVNEKAEYNIVVRTRLQNFSLIFGAEVDGLKDAEAKYPKETGKVNKYVELKTSRIISNERQNRNFNRFKLIKWWCQSYMIGIPKIYCGFRDDDGIVHSVDKFETQDLPDLGQEFWSSSVAMNFLNEFLTFVKKNVTEDNPKLVYKFEWKPGYNVRYEKLTNAGNLEILRPWFINSF